MIVSELIQALSSFPPNAAIAGTFEGQIRRISVYAARDGTVLLDVDDCFYKELFQSEDGGKYVAAILEKRNGKV